MIKGTAIKGNAILEECEDAVIKFALEKLLGKSKGDAVDASITSITKEINSGVNPEVALITVGAQIITSKIPTPEGQIIGTVLTTIATEALEGKKISQILTDLLNSLA